MSCSSLWAPCTQCQALNTIALSGPFQGVRGRADSKMVIEKFGQDPITVVGP